MDAQLQFQFQFQSRRLLDGSQTENPPSAQDSPINESSCQGISTFLFCVILIGTLICIFSYILSRFNRSSASSSPPASSDPADLSNFRAFIYGESTSSDLPSTSPESAFDYENCAICLAEFQKGEELRLLPRCKHLFHKDCIDLWIPAKSLCCPVCRDRTIKQAVATSTRPCSADALVLSIGLAGTSTANSRI